MNDEEKWIWKEAVMAFEGPTLTSAWKDRKICQILNQVPYK
jgi:hypothetical protein